MSVWFVAGAGTDIGKTYVAAQLIRRVRATGRPVRALKPVASGVAPIDTEAFGGSDTAMLLQALGLPITAETVEACSPWRFSAPLSPNMAAAAEGRSLPLEMVLDWCQQRIAAAPSDSLTLIEGAGGVMSPIAEDALNLDLIKALACPVVLVGGTYLGGLSHVLTALEALRAHGVRVGPVILNESIGSTVDFESSRATLTQFAPDVDIVPLRQDDALPAIDLR